MKIKNLFFAFTAILLVCTVNTSCITNPKKGMTDEHVEFRMVPYRILSDTVNEDFTKNQGRVRFVVDLDYFDSYEVIPTLKTSVNGVWKDKSIDSLAAFEYMVEPGSYQFLFYANDDMVEIGIPKIDVKEQHDITVRLSFYLRKKTEPRNQLEKPVIYIYSDEEVPLEIGVKPKGELAFTYPETKGIWSGTAKKSGFDINGRHYPYLFWEAKMEIPTNLKWESASVISKDQVLTYLEAVCDKVGLNDSERTDLITYWGPRMMEYEQLQVLALTGNVDELFGELTVSNGLFKMERFYLVFKETSGKTERLNLTNLRPFKRTSKFILEWGGFDATKPGV